MLWERASWTVTVWPDCCPYCFSSSWNIWRKRAEVMVRGPAVITASLAMPFRNTSRMPQIRKLPASTASSSLAMGVLAKVRN